MNAAEFRDRVPPEEVVTAVGRVRNAVNDVHSRIRDGGADPPLTCGDVVDDLGTAVDNYVSITEAFTVGETNSMDKQLIATFDVSVAADIAPLLVFEDVDSSVLAIGLTYQYPLPDKAEALTLVSTGEYATTVELSGPPSAPAEPDPTVDVLRDHTLSLVKTIVGRATHSITRVLAGGIPGIGHYLTVQFPALHHGLGRLAAHVRLLLSRALTFTTAHFGDWAGEVAAFANEFNLIEKLEEKIVGGPLNWLLRTEEVREELSARVDLAASGVNEKLLKKLDKSNNRRVGWAGNAAPIVLGALATVTLGGGVPALPVAAAVLLAWILLVSADQLASPVGWRLHAFRGIPGTSR